MTDQPKPLASRRRSRTTAKSVLLAAVIGAGVVAAITVPPALDSKPSLGSVEASLPPAPTTPVVEFASCTLGTMDHWYDGPYWQLVGTERPLPAGVRATCHQAGPPWALTYYWALSCTKEMAGYCRLYPTIQAPA